MVGLTVDVFLQSVLKQRFHGNPIFSFGYNISENVDFS